MSAPALQWQRLGQFAPLALMGHLDGAAGALAQLVGGVVETKQGGGQVLRAEVVDHLELGLACRFHLGRCNDPAERVALLAQIARQLAVEVLSGYADVLVVKIDAQVDLILIII